MNVKKCLSALLVLLGCIIARAEDIDGSIFYMDTNRTYYLHTPPQYDGITAVPLVINMHFYGGSGHYQASASGMNAKSDAEGFIVVYPDAYGFPPSWKMDIDLGFISNLMDSLIADYSIDTLRIFAAGYSNGAFMAHVLACNLSSRIAAAAFVSGGLMITDWSEFKLERAISTMHFHARNDPVLPYYGDEYYAPVEDMVSSWAGVNGCETGPDSFYGPTGALRQRWSNQENDMEIILWSTDNADHGWPQDTNAYKISANDEMWDFFVAHPLPPHQSIDEKPLSPGHPATLEHRTISRNSLIIRFALPKRESVYPQIFDASGRRCMFPFEVVREAGECRVVLDISNAGSGVYFCRIITPSRAFSGSFVVIH